MALSHSPKIVTDGLVFMYDTGDGKSYKGEPTTNVVANPLPTTGWSVSQAQGSALTRTYLTEDGIPFMRFSSVTNGIDYPRVTNSVFANSATITGTFSTSLEVKGTAGAVLRLRIYENGSTKITNSITLTSEWTRYTFDNQSTEFNLNQPYFNPATSNAIYDIRNIQIEAKSHSTPFVNGTRSATQGLIDRTGNSIIDLSDVSFDSNAQITFNNTTGGMTGVPVAHSYLSSSAIEVVVNPNTLNDKDMVGGYRHNNGYSSPTIGAIYIQYNRFYASVITAAEVYRQVSSNTISANQYYHVVLNKDTVDGQLELFVNGVSQGTVSFDAATYGQWATAGNYIGTNTLDIGVSTNTNSSQGWGSSTLDGQIPIFKVYNRTLTSTEVLQNYNATKGRFL